MPYGTKPAGKAKPSNYPYGQAGSGTEMVSKKGSFSSRETNKGPGLVAGGRGKGYTKTFGRGK